jgi:hypothetical protein
MTILWIKCNTTTVNVAHFVTSIHKTFFSHHNIDVHNHMMPVLFVE